MTRNIALAFMTLVLGSLVFETTEASAKAALKGQSGSFLGFQRIGIRGGAWGPGFGFAVRPGGLRAHRGCYTQRFVTDDGEFIVRRVSY